MYPANKKTKKGKRKYLQACKYSQIAGLDVQKMKMQRYYMPIALDVEGGAGKGKLDKKVIEVEYDMSDFYLSNRNNWRDNFVLTSPNKNYSDFLPKYDYEDTYQNSKNKYEPDNYEYDP